jgi:hypothetical protein
MEIMYVHCCFLLCIHGRKWKCIDGFGEGTSKTDFLRNLGVDRRIILKWILKQLDGRVWA